MSQEVDRRDYFAAFFISLFFLILYLFFLNDNMTHAHDAETYYHNILNNPQWHGNHLIYDFCARLWHDVWYALLPENTSSFRIVASMNSLFGAALTGILFIFFRKNIDLLRSYSLVAIGIVGFSFYFLTYSATIEIYMPVLCLSFLTLIMARTLKITIGSAVIIGLVHGIAMLWHQMAFLFGFTIILSFLPYRKEAFYYLLSGSFVVLSAYGYAAWDLDIDNISDFFKLLSGYFSNDTVLGHREKSPPYLAIMGLGMALLGGRLVVAIEPFKGLIETYFADHSFERLIYLHHQTNGLEIFIQLAAYGAFAVCFIYMVYHYICTKKEYQPVQELWVLLISHSVFFIFWFPHNPEFWAVQMICCVGLLLQAQPKMKPSFIMVLSIAIINIMGTALPLKNPDNDIYHKNKTLDSV